ncbi:hypothetical protein [Tropicibacter oceani]|uniref:Uncharacterized protein n=1 Tax=Tropicibacter oceani TaxID=3058420 RepID=A0ABY8QIU0_9RHOB|nr:hypothetical protein [Tropicibacter oceani]WGW03931.1 hypothetical protein QF118_18755 [Tropicibacter oceani]
MRLFALAFLTGLALLPRPGDAGTAVETLHHLGASEVVGADGEPLALCLVTRTRYVGQVPLWHRAGGYALATDDCATDSYLPLDTDGFALLRAHGQVASTLPLTPRITFTDMLAQSWGSLTIAALIASAFALRGRRRKRHRGKPAQVRVEPV